ncbi:MAG: hypothetical protein CME70_14385 [Halobacteriovorax sp.]|nr:hypothetical protein [Halobacteriovorax sp.]|tara:strand:- start:259084 stop:259776 length:693 start_codon:yes stop_codon:yes gene_type:complete
MKKSILIQTLIAALLTLSMPSAYALDKCKAVKLMQKDLNEKKKDLEKLEAIHREQVEAKEIADRLMNGDEITEIRLLAEALDEEVGNISKDQKTQGKYVGATVGAVILSSYIIKKLNKGSVGFKRKFLAQALPKDRRFGRHTLNAALVFSLASTFWLAYSIKENQDKKTMLAELVNKLNKIKDLTEEVLDLREEVEEREVTFNLKLEEILYEGLVEVITSNDGKQTLNCK